MKRFLWACACTLMLVLPAVAETVIDFEELDGYTNTLPMEKGQYFDGYGAAASTGAFVSKETSFQTNQYGPGFSYSNVNDATTPGFGNQFASYPGGGSAGNGVVATGTNYAMVATGSSAFSDGSPNNGATMNFNNLVELMSIDVANTTYAAIYMDQGKYTDLMGNEVIDTSAAFTDDDFLRLTITGFDGADGAGSITGQLNYDLANYAGPGDQDDFLLSTWQTVDLSAFEETKSLRLATSSSRNSTFGDFTYSDVPAFAAIDNIRYVTAIPEPGSAGLLGMAFGWLLCRRRRRK